MDVDYGQIARNEQLTRDKSRNVHIPNHLFFSSPSLLRTLRSSRKQQRWLVACGSRSALSDHHDGDDAEKYRDPDNIRFVIGQRASQSERLDDIRARKMCL